MPKDFIHLDLPMPPMLPRLIGITSESRFVGLYWYGSKPYWTDGQRHSSFSFHSAWNPFVRHPVVVWELSRIGNVFLGDGDNEATHQILCDRTGDNGSDAALYVAPITPAARFLKAQHPKANAEPRILTNQEWTQMVQELDRRFQSQMPRLGMFEGPLFGQFRPTTPEVVSEELDMQWQHSELVDWINDRVPAAMIQDYARMLNVSEALALEMIRGDIR